MPWPFSLKYAAVIVIPKSAQLLLRLTQRIIIIDIIIWLTSCGPLCYCNVIVDTELSHAVSSSTDSCRIACHWASGATCNRTVNMLIDFHRFLLSLFS